MRYRLRFSSHDLDLVSGQFVLGREADCVIRIDDAAASRHHARLDVGSRGVTLTDLGSRNGTFVNGEPLGSAPYELSTGDTIRIGAEEFTFVMVDSPQDTGLHATMTLPQCPACRSEIAFGDVTCHKCGAAVRPASDKDDDDRITARLSLGDLAEKALQMGRLNEAQRCLELQLRDYVRRPVPQTPDAQVEGVVRTLLKVAVAARDASWIDRLFSLFAVRQWWVSKALTSEVQQALGELRMSGAGLAEYLTLWKSRAASLSSEEQAELARLSELGPPP